jgi:hypothetical protein
LRHNDNGNINSLPMPGNFMIAKANEKRWGRWLVVACLMVLGPNARYRAAIKAQAVLPSTDQRLCTIAN